MMMMMEMMMVMMIQPKQDAPDRKSSQVSVFATCYVVNHCSDYHDYHGCDHNNYFIITILNRMTSLQSVMSSITAIGNY